MGVVTIDMQKCIRIFHIQRIIATGVVVVTSTSTSSIVNVMLYRFIKSMTI